MNSKRNFYILHYIFFLFIIILTGCSQNGDKGFKTTIRGSFPALGGKTVTLSEFDINSAIPLDTTKISKDGSFKFTFRRNNPGFYLIKTDNRSFVTLILDQEKKVEIYSDQKNIKKNYTVKGSPDSEFFRDFEMFLEINRNKIDSLSKKFNDYQRSSNFQSMKMDLDKRYQDIFINQHQYTIQFLKDHCSSLASLLVINRRFGERKILNEEEDFEYFAMVDSCLSAIYPDNKHLLDFQQRLTTFKDERKIFEMTEKRLANGNKVPDIGLQDQSGKTVQLHSFQGKPVILYFWASWDEESRKANKLLKEMLEKAGTAKPAVYAIGLESYKELWTDAIRADGIQNWTHVTDYLNIYSSAKTLFNIPDRFPYFLYLDNNLIIKYKGNDFNELAIEIFR
jgi:thiol-disulfide isomerase/thioredoxin